MDVKFAHYLETVNAQLIILRKLGTYNASKQYTPSNAHAHSLLDSSDFEFAYAIEIMSLNHYINSSHKFTFTKQCVTIVLTSLLHVVNYHQLHLWAMMIQWNIQSIQSPPSIPSIRLPLPVRQTHSQLMRSWRMHHYAKCVQGNLWKLNQKSETWQWFKTIFEPIQCILANYCHETSSFHHLLACCLVCYKAVRNIQWTMEEGNLTLSSSSLPIAIYMIVQIQSRSIHFLVRWVQKSSAYPTSLSSAFKRF